MSRFKHPDREDQIGAFVKARRKANQLTQRDLGRLAGVGERFIVELEAGKPTLRKDRIEAVLQVFGKRLGIADAARPDDEGEVG